MANDLEDLIRAYVPLRNHPNPQGWFSVLCKVCGDHGRKGERAGFKFDQTATGYHCFNCGCKATYDSGSDEELSREMKKVLRAYGVPESDWGKVLFNSLVQRNATGKVERVKAQQVEHEPSQLSLPKFFYPLTDDPDDEWAQFAMFYLKEDRSIEWDSYQFMLAKETDDPKSKAWTGRVIIPIYKNNKLIFYQGRDMTGLRIKKYLSPGSPKGGVMYGFDHIFGRHDRDEPLYVVEGWFDAFPIQGVAVFGNVLTPSQIYWLNRTPRPKVIIPDKHGDGFMLGKQALDMGWSIATPDIGDCKDVNEAMKKYGLLYVIDTLRDNIYNGFEGYTRLGVYCE